MNHWYWIYGLTLRSEILCPELPQIDATDSPDVAIMLAQAGAVKMDDGEAHVSDIADIALYRMEGGREILVAPVPGARAEDVRQYLYGVAMTAILYQRGETPIHAGAVAAGGRAHLFCGESGAGKSTLMTQLGRRGLDVLCDDVGVIRQGPDDVVHFYPGVPRIKLWQDALTHFDIDSAGLQRDLARHDKFHMPLKDRAFDSLPLASIFSLIPRQEVDEPAIVAISPRGAFEVLMRNTYRPRLLKRLGDPASHVLRCAAAVRQAAGYEFRRPWGLDRLDACTDALISQLAFTAATGAER